jgi:hypothetical protein
MRRLFEASKEGLGGIVFFLVKILKKVVGVRFINLCFKGSIKTIRYAMYSERKVSILELGMMVEKGE